jgi:hypothetical protein
MTSEVKEKRNKAKQTGEHQSYTYTRYSLVCVFGYGRGIRMEIITHGFFSFPSS